MADGIFRTDDMTLVAVLCMHGHAYSLEVVQGQGGRNRANWVFAVEDQGKGFRELVKEYNHTRLRVEPQTFVRTLAKVRSEMYVEIPPEPRESRMRQVSSA